MISARGVQLRPILESDYETLRAAEIAASMGGRWRFVGATPSPESYPRLLWNDVLAQFLVCTESPASVTGLVSAYSFEPDVGVVSVAAVTLGDEALSTITTFGTALFIDWLFDSHPIRKIRIETPEWNLCDLGGLTRHEVAVEEGRLRSERFRRGQYFDVVLFAVWREAWMSARGKFLGSK